jgi:hypothetical protein
VSPGSPARLVKLELIRFSRDAWPRRYLDEERVEDFAALYREQGPNALPALELVDDGHGRLLFGDGVHRCEGGRKAGLSELPASVLVPDPGVDPVSFAYRHALMRSAVSSKPLNRAEKRAAIRRLLREQPDSSDREMARLVGVDHKTVGRLRRELEVPNLLGDGAGATVRVGPSPEAVAKRLFRAFEQTYQARGLGVADFFTGDRTGERLASVLESVYGEHALERARTFSQWLERAVGALERDA